MRETSVSSESADGLVRSLGARNLSAVQITWGVFGRGTIFALGLLIAGCSPRPATVGAPAAPTRSEIWAAIQPQAERYHIEPSFVFALIAAESDFNAAAQSGEARGLLQLKAGAWREVTDVAYEPAVWDWRINLKAGIDYLAYLRSALVRVRHFSYPLWVAAYHYGFDAVQQGKFEIEAFPPPGNATFEALWKGERAPVAPP